MDNIQQRRLSILDNISKSFVKSQNSELGEFYTELSIKSYVKDLNKAFSNNQITVEEFEKGKKDLSKLAMKQIIDSNGHKRIVYVKIHQDEHGQEKETDYDKGHTVKFTKDGEEHIGKIHSLKFHDKTDKLGTAMVDVDGKKHSVSLNKLEHHDEDNKGDEESYKKDIEKDEDSYKKEAEKDDSTYKEDKRPKPGSIAEKVALREANKKQEKTEIETLHDEAKKIGLFGYENMNKTMLKDKIKNFKGGKDEIKTTSQKQIDKHTQAMDEGATEVEADQIARGKRNVGDHSGKKDTTQEQYHPLGTKVTVQGRDGSGKIVKLPSNTTEQYSVDFGNGNVYGIMPNRISPLKGDVKKEAKNDESSQPDDDEELKKMKNTKKVVILQDLSEHGVKEVALRKEYDEVLKKHGFESDEATKLRKQMNSLGEEGVKLKKEYDSQKRFKKSISENDIEKAFNKLGSF